MDAECRANTLKLMPRSYSLRRLLETASYIGCGNILFRDMTTQAQRCGPGTLFVALSGTEHRQGEFLRLAAARGAAGVLTDLPLPDLAIPQCLVPDVRAVHGRLCQILAGCPAQKLQITGVTGTNGKTTVAWMLRAIWRQAGLQAGLLGTVEYDDGQACPAPASLTTPSAETLAEWMSRMVAAGTTQLAMEVSSHALDQRRIAGCRLGTAIITNITQDHLDYHGDFYRYQQAKARIADYCRPEGMLIINGDDGAITTALVRHDRSGRELSELVQVGFESHNQIQIQVSEESLTGSTFRLIEQSAWPNREHLPALNLSLQIGIPGRFNLLNAALAAVAAWSQGVALEAIKTALETMSFPPGRMQPVNCRQEFGCLVDYAHTPDAIAQVLQTVRPVVPGRLICLFGAGGNRDRIKRPEMARAAQAADLVILTSDNSRDEPIEQIFSDLLSGFGAEAPPVLSIVDRAEAIDRAICLAEPGDCVLILGKGHETTQEIAGEKGYFDDAAIACASIYKQNPRLAVIADQSEWGANADKTAAVATPEKRSA